MLITGASRHAKDLLTALNTFEEVVFYDDVTENLPNTFLEKFPILRSPAEARNFFHTKSANFVLGLGGTLNREKVSDKLIALGGNLNSVISDSALIGDNDVTIKKGVNIMPFSFVSNSTHIGKGTLVNCKASFHHDSKAGDFCDIGPGATILGGAQIGNFTMIGSGAIILPDVKIGDNVIVGAGSVITKNIPGNSIVYGVPGKIKN